jgi:hypothetical protein
MGVICFNMFLFGDDLFLDQKNMIITVIYQGISTRKLLHHYIYRYVCMYVRTYVCMYVGR